MLLVYNNLHLIRSQKKSEEIILFYLVNKIFNLNHISDQLYINHYVGIAKNKNKNKKWRKFMCQNIHFNPPTKLSLVRVWTSEIRFAKSRSTMDEQKIPPPHVLIFPLPLQGPVNSMLKLAELLCLAGLQTTFVVTDYIYARLVRFSNIRTRFDCYPGFQIKTVSDGLPEDHPRGDRFMELFDSLKSKTKPLFKDLLISLNDSGSRRPPVTCIIADGILGFTGDVADEVGIPMFYVRTISACCLWVFFCLPKLIEAGEFPFRGE